MIGDKELLLAVNAMLTCSPLECAKESACLLVAKQVKDWLMLHQEHQVMMNQESDPGVITDYAPSWECPGC